MFVYAREPKRDEMAVAIKHLVKNAGEKPDKSTVAAEKSAVEDILWALINTKEFLFNH